MNQCMWIMWPVPVEKIKSNKYDKNNNSSHITWFAKQQYKSAIEKKKERTV